MCSLMHAAHYIVETWASCHTFYPRVYFTESFQQQIKLLLFI